MRLKTPCGKGSRRSSTPTRGRNSPAWRLPRSWKPPGCGISMDGRGRWLDNVFVERLWRSLKYEEVHLKAYANGLEARIGIGHWLRFYNRRRAQPGAEEQKNTPG